jgi:protein involved in polysaccharide export with SLBB domain
VRINGTTSASTACTFSGSTTSSTVSGTYAVSPGDTIDVLITNSNNTNTRSVSWGLGG